MDSGGEKSKDFYGVLGLKKECSVGELRSAYKKLAMKWHPDRCSMAGNVKQVEDAKTKFQAIQEAYSVLSDPNKRFLYDCGVYDCEDEDDQNGMGEFLNEMATMMSQNKPTNENAEESFAELQDLFEEIFQTDVDAYVSSSSTWIPASSCSSSSSSSFFPTQSFDPYNNASANNKRDSSHMNTTNGSENMANNQFEGFNIGTGGTSGKCKNSKRGASQGQRKERVE